MTTIRTTGSADSYQELNLKRRQRLGDDRRARASSSPGPYLQGAGPGRARCTRSPVPDDARRMVRYWAEEGVTWFKAYTQISRAELGAAIDEAHKHGVKVTGASLLRRLPRGRRARHRQARARVAHEQEFFGQAAGPVPAGAAESSCTVTFDSTAPTVQQTIQGDGGEEGRADFDARRVRALVSPSRVPFDQRVLDALAPRRRRSIAAYYDAARRQRRVERRRVQEGDGIRARVREGRRTAGRGFRSVLPQLDRRLWRPAQLRAADRGRLHCRSRRCRS